HEGAEDVGTPQVAAARAAGAGDRPGLRVSSINRITWNLPRRYKLEEVARTAEHVCQAFALGKPQAQAQQDLARIEQPHRSISDDGKTIVLKVPPPPAGVEQPQLRDNVSARPVPPGKAETDGVPGSPVPGRSQTSHLRCAWRRPRHELRHR